ncbi:MAG TPA: YfiR family protein [Caulobacteraceae bacterium]|nr:YfiR family protein [Caulobacteraceae bacterium]
MKAGWAIRAAALASFAVLASAAPRAHAQSLEYPVKAAFLYKFAPFVEWPPRAFDGAASPLNICIVGHDPFGAALDRAVAGKRLGARPVVARRMEAIGANSGCHIAYFGGSVRQSVADGLAAVQGAPVLTVTDQSMASARGAVHFVVSENRVRFHIDDTAASRNGVSLSSKLMQLALSVKRRGRG